MTISWLAQFVFTVAYFIAWYVGQIPHTFWLNVTAIAALVWALCLLFDNRTVFTNRER